MNFYYIYIYDFISGFYLKNIKNYLILSYRIIIA